MASPIDQVNRWSQFSLDELQLLNAALVYFGQAAAVPHTRRKCFKLHQGIIDFMYGDQETQQGAETETEPT